MARHVNAKHPVNDLIRRRWSPRAFAEKPVERQKLLSVLEAARWAPSCFNAQPWSFIVATKNNPEAFDRMLACLVEPNQVWARTAPVLMISVASLNFAHNRKPNRHAAHDVGMASAFLTIEATSLDLFVHFMAGFSVEKARETYGLPADTEPMAAFSLGYLGDPAVLPEPVRAKEHVPSLRKPLKDFIFADKWGQRPAWMPE